MPVCPACGLANDDSFQRCGRCGAPLAALPFAAVTPATRRMGRTMLGVAPLPGGVAKDACPPNETGPDAFDAGTPIDTHQPFAPVPATLAGLNANNDKEVRPETESADAVPATLKGARTLAGFAAPPLASSDSAETHAPMAHATLMGVSPLVANQGLPDAAPPATTPILPNATLMGVSPLVANQGLPDATGRNLSRSLPATEAQRRPEEERETTPHAPIAHATLMGVSPLAGNQGQPDAAPPAANAILPNATLMGVSPFIDLQGRSASARAEPARSAVLKQTLLGVLPPQPELRDPDHAAPTPGLDAKGALSTTVPAMAQTTKMVMHGTLLGVAPAMATPTTTAGPHHGPGPDPSQDAEPARQQKGTLLGVAMPGIAPLQPGHFKQEFQGPGAAPQWAPRRPSSNPPEPPTTTRDIELRSKQWRRLAWIFGTAAALLMIVIVVALSVWWTNVRLTVQVTSGDSGAEQLVLTCSNCPDGTLASIEDSHAKFKDKRASIELTRRLSVGQNQLTLRVTRPNRTRNEVVNVTVPVDFRVTSSVAELTAVPPSISVQLESTPGTRFVVEGLTHTVGTAGKLTVPIDVSASLTGPASVVVPFERRMAYEVLREGSAKKGTLVVRTGITALDVVTPGLTHITQNPTFTLSGRTSPGAQLTANGHPIPVSQDGSFRQEMALSAPGSTKLVVRAVEPNQAPRLIEIALERVTNLKQRADELAKSLVTDFDAISVLISEKPDSMVAMRGEVVVIETMNASTRIVGAAKCRREPCLFSVRLGGPLSLRTGVRFLSIGRARLSPRSTNAAEHDITLDASLVVEDSGR